MVTIGAGKRVDHMRRRVMALLPDTCRIYPNIREVDQAGGWYERLGDPVLYKNSPDIPCRLDPTRHYRREDIFGQELLPSEYMINVPYDVELTANHVIEFKNVKYEIRKILEHQTDGIVARALVIELE